jgi:ribose transport system permease protein
LNTTVQKAPSADEPRRSRLAGGRFSAHGFAPWALPMVFVLMVAFFSIARPDTYFTSGNFKTIAVTQAVLAILALAAMLPLIAGSFDVSIGANLGLGGVLCTGLSAHSHLPGGLAVVIAIAVCTSVGLINGLLVAKGGINAFIATLGTSSVITGVVVWYSSGAVIFERVPRIVTSVGQSEFLGIALPVWIMAGVGLILWYITQQTPIGRYLYALGDSIDAARLSGINVGALTILAFVGAGFLAGLAGVVQAGEISAGNPTVGPSFLLPAFAAAFLGATAIKIGSFNVLGTLLAVYLLAAGVQGLEQMGVASYVEPVFNGVALIVGVGLVRWLRKDTALI